ncbi:MAG: 2-amino-4-hydroxy-6-hydroxymethyldihydropteridine diphosphokinase, partial [Gemmataceae bacterium]
MNTIAYLGLGSNLGDREKQIRAAVSAIGSIPEVRLLRTSAYFETEPVGGPDRQPLYLNAVA